MGYKNRYLKSVNKGNVLIIFFAQKKTEVNEVFKNVKFYAKVLPFFFCGGGGLPNTTPCICLGWKICKHFLMFFRDF